MAKHKKKLSVSLDHISAAVVKLLKAEQQEETEQPKKKEPLLLVGGITDFSCKLYEELLTRSFGSEVTLFIDSEGGDVAASLAMCRMLEIKRFDTTAVVLGDCSSAAISIFATCKHRYVQPSSVIAFHRIWVNIPKRRTAPQIKGFSGVIEALEATTDEFVAEHLGISKKKLRKLCDKERWLFGRDVIKRGWAQEWTGEGL